MNIAHRCPLSRPSETPTHHSILTTLIIMQRPVANPPSRPIKLDPLPEYPEIILALNMLPVHPVRFHWMLFVPDPDATRQAVTPGTKLHVVQRLAPDGIHGWWGYEAARFTLGTSRSVVAAAILGRLPAGKTVTDLSALLWRFVPTAVPAVDTAREPVFNCRVWVREAVRCMHPHGYINCPDVDALEREMLQYGTEATTSIANNTFRRAGLVHAVNSRAVQ